MSKEKFNETPTREDSVNQKSKNSKREQEIQDFVDAVVGSILQPFLSIAKLFQKNTKPPRKTKSQEVVYEKPSSKSYDTIQFSFPEKKHSTRLTHDFLSNTLVPYLKAITQLQEIFDEIQNQTHRGVFIKSISQNSPISASLEGATNAIQLVRDSVVPWRSKHSRTMAELLESEKIYEIENKKAEILEKRAIAAKDRVESRKVEVEVEQQREELEKMRLENQKLRFELNREKIQLALTVLEHISPNLSETDKIAYTVKVLKALDDLTTSELNLLSE